MEVKQIHGLCYSATGVTEKVVRVLMAGLEEALGLSGAEFHSFRKPGERAVDYAFGPGDLVVVGSPTYAGRMPNKIAPDFQARLQGSGALAVAAVTFGNRAYENSLAELCALLEAKGFHTVAAGAFPGRHAFTDALGEGRPAWDDKRAAGGGPGRPGSALLHTQGPGRGAGEVFKGQAKNGPGQVL